MEANFVVTNELQHRYEAVDETASEAGVIHQPEDGHTSQLGGIPEPEGGQISELGGIPEPEGGHTSELGGTAEPEGGHISELGGIPDPEGGHTSELGGTAEPECGHTSELGGTAEPEGGHTSELGVIPEPEGGHAVIELEMELNDISNNKTFGESDTITFGTHDILPDWKSVNELNSESVSPSSLYIDLVVTEPHVEPTINFSKQQESNTQSVISFSGREAKFKGDFGLTEVRVFVILYCICMALIIIGNALVVIVILKNHHLRTNISNIFLLSLVNARACLGLFVIPVRISSLFSERYLGSILCKLCHFGALGSSCISVFSIVAIAIVKYHAVVKNTKEQLTIHQSLVAITVLWCSGFLYAIRAVIINDLQVIKVGDMYIWSCIAKPMYFDIYIYIILADMIFLCILPFGIVLICHFHIISSLKHNITIILLSRGIVMRHNAKTVRMLIILMTLFAICSLVPMIFTIYCESVGGAFSNIYLIGHVISLFSFSNSWFNIIVFAIFRDDLWMGFINLFKNNDSSQNSSTNAK